MMVAIVMNCQIGSDSERETVEKPQKRLLSFLLKLSLLGTVLILSFIVCEIILHLFWPMQYIVPANDWTPEYGVIAYPDTKIVNAKPGHFHYIYTTNSQRYRGPLIDPDSCQTKIILLGDSNVFGFGVNDDETISHCLNQLFNENTIVVNLANGGWSLPQQVRRYIELGQKMQPTTLVLHFADNDLEDFIYGINWVATADDEGKIRLYIVPENPAGRFRKILPPDGFLYRTLFSLQICMRFKALINRYAMHGLADVRTNPDGRTELIKPFRKERKGLIVPRDKVIVMDPEENERRYIRLLRAFAKLLKNQNVRFIFLSDDKEFYGYSKIKKATQELIAHNLLEHYSIDSWFIAGVDYPISSQGHQWGKEASKALAGHLYTLLKQDD